MSRKKVVILFTELSDYMLNLYRYWVDNSSVELYIYREEVNQKEAPFQLDLTYPYIHIYNKEGLTKNKLQQAIKSIEPNMIICSGWSDRLYLDIASSYSGTIPTIFTMDNRWRGSLKQYIAITISKILLVPRFSHIWVPGIPQIEYAKRLGFVDEQILTGYYVANSNIFSQRAIDPKRDFKKRFIFVGRYREDKGILDLWRAFDILCSEYPNDWKLLCIGTGELYKQRVEHPQIEHLGFLQPIEFKEYMRDGGVFILPSHFEPWGVVVHEFAMAGFPMILSDEVGASTQFLKDKENGFIFKHKDIDDLKDKMKKIITSSKTELTNMGRLSYNLSQTIDEKAWIDKIDMILGLHYD
ncbi:Glycosyltransferase [hydrothermal vent metagenome]|uniref:Glycosyltransferase n=1 Tax=hydrothermal vent metagenome TaxID=652676 RepID=A0A1W1C1M6_9ZZZZ